MTDLQKRVADEWVIDHNAQRAGERAGVGGENIRITVWQMLQNQDVQEYIELREAEINEQTLISAAWVRERFKAISDRCMNAEPVMIRDGKRMVQAEDEQGRKIWQFDSAGANTATAHLGKIIGVFEKDNQQRTPNIKILNVDPLANVDDNDRTTEDLGSPEED